MTKYRNMTDPTREEIEVALRNLPELWDDEISKEFDVEEGIYWFASDWHGGQYSNLYSVLSTSKYRPGINTNGCNPEESSSYVVYELLEESFGIPERVV